MKIACVHNSLSLNLRRSCTQFVCFAGADPFAVDRNGQTALECAMHVAAAPDNTTPQETWNHVIEQLSAAGTSQRRVSSGGRASKSRSTSGAGAGASAAVTDTPSSATRTSMIPKAAGTTPKATPTRTSRAQGTPTRATTATTTSSVPSSPATTTAARTSTEATPDRRPSTASSVSIGDRVEANGKTGLVRFKGPVQFHKSGEFLFCVCCCCCCCTPAKTSATISARPAINVGCRETRCDATSKICTTREHHHQHHDQYHHHTHTTNTNSSATNQRTRTRAHKRHYCLSHCRPY
jgi:hypothetical protein